MKLVDRAPSNCNSCGLSPVCSGQYLSKVVQERVKEYNNVNTMSGNDRRQKSEKLSNVRSALIVVASQTSIAVHFLIIFLALCIIKSRNMLPVVCCTLVTI